MSKKRENFVCHRITVSTTLDLVGLALRVHISLCEVGIILSKLQIVYYKQITNILLCIFLKLIHKADVAACMVYKKSEVAQIKPKNLS